MHELVAVLLGQISGTAGELRRGTGDGNQRRTGHVADLPPHPSSISGVRPTFISPHRGASAAEQISRSNFGASRPLTAASTGEWPQYHGAPAETLLSVSSTLARQLFILCPGSLSFMAVLLRSMPPRRRPGRLIGRAIAGSGRWGSKISAYTIRDSPAFTRRRGIEDSMEATTGSLVSLDVRNASKSSRPEVATRMR